MASAYRPALRSSMTFLLSSFASVCCADTIAGLPKSNVAATTTVPSFRSDRMMLSIGHRSLSPLRQIGAARARRLMLGHDLVETEFCLAREQRLIYRFRLNRVDASRDI